MNTPKGNSLFLWLRGNMKLAVIGTTTFKNYNHLSKKIRENFNVEDDVEEIISGGAPGADTLAEKFAKENNIPFTKFKADWSTYGKFAGQIRNRLIINRADAVIAFWDWKSRGTKHSIETAKRLEKKVIIENIAEME